MDAFVIRKASGESSAPGKLNRIPKPRGQRKLTDLDGVVKLDLINQAVNDLNNPDVPDERKVELLKNLRRKSPATEIIKSSGIGKIIRKLAKDVGASPRVISAAKKVNIFRKEDVFRENDHNF